MKTIKYFFFTLIIFILLIISVPTISEANSLEPNSTTINEANNYVEYIYIDGVRYTYTYSDDGKLIEIEADD